MSNTGTLHKVIQAAHRTTYLNLVHEAFSRTLHPHGLLRLRELLVTNKVVPVLAPHIDVLATITGTTLDLLHVVIRGLLWLLVRRTASGRGRGHHWSLVWARGAHG